MDRVSAAPASAPARPPRAQVRAPGEKPARWPRAKLRRALWEVAGVRVRVGEGGGEAQGGLSLDGEAAWWEAVEERARVGAAVARRLGAEEAAGWVESVARERRRAEGRERRDGASVAERALAAGSHEALLTEVVRRAFEAGGVSRPESGRGDVEVDPTHAFLSWLQAALVELQRRARAAKRAEEEKARPQREADERERLEREMDEAVESYAQRRTLRRPTVMVAVSLPPKAKAITATTTTTTTNENAGGGGGGKLPYEDLEALLDFVLTDARWARPGSALPPKAREAAFDKRYVATLRAQLFLAERRALQRLERVRELERALREVERVCSAPDAAAHVGRIARAALSSHDHDAPPAPPRERVAASLHAALSLLASPSPPNVDNAVSLLRQAALDAVSL